MYYSIISIIDLEIINQHLKYKLSLEVKISLRPCAHWRYGKEIEYREYVTLRYGYKIVFIYLYFSGIIKRSCSWRSSVRESENVLRYAFGNQRTSCDLKEAYTRTNIAKSRWYASTFLRKTCLRVCTNDKRSLSVRCELSVWGPLFIHWQQSS